MLHSNIFLLIFIYPIFIECGVVTNAENGERSEKPLRFRSMKNQDSANDITNMNTDISQGNEPFLMADSSVEEEECVALPNRTRVRPSFFQCRQDTKFELHGGAITNINGDDTYPVSFDSPIRVFLDVTSNSNKRFDNIGVEVSVFKRSTGWFGCGWMFLPSFGLLSNYDMCNDNPSCPVTPGRQVIEFEIDSTKLFNNFFKMIHEDMSAYQLEVRLRDNRDPYRELLCATIQTRIHL